MENYAELMFTQAVQDLQSDEGSKERFEAFYPHRTQKSLSDEDVAFVRSRNSFYMATVNSDGWPYIQHRGGEQGFVNVIGPTTLACADYPGNKQFISMGNLKTDSRVSLFFMDYANRARLKVQGHATLISAVNADQSLLSKLDQRAAPAERILQIEILAMDWNCPKYIPTMLSEAEILATIAPQLDALRSENAALRAELAQKSSSN
ncbi:MAG: pyridoxamine 5'-phosphate oxidase family protein [Rhizobiaceae bacterium]